MKAPHLMRFQQVLALGILGSVAIFIAARYYEYSPKRTPSLKTIELYETIRPSIQRRFKSSQVKSSSNGSRSSSNLISPSDRNVFFIETSCSDAYQQQTGLSLTLRQACAIYSTAILNPTREVTLVTTCSLGESDYEESSNYRALFALPNVGVAVLGMREFLEETPLESLLEGKLARSLYPTVHSSDLLRMLIVYWFGGTYMDLDFISLKPLDDLGRNFIGAENSDNLNTAVFNFEPNHQFLKEMILKAAALYDPSEWSHIGPALATAVFWSFCNVSYGASLINGFEGLSCNITVLKPEIFYPTFWVTLFTDDLESSRGLLGGPHAVHLYNKLTFNAPIRFGSKQAFAELVTKHCSVLVNV